LERTEATALNQLNHRLIFLSTVLFIISNAVDNPFQISLADADSCPEFGQRRQLRAWGAIVDSGRMP
jgi:hypothetical protein